MMNEAAKTKKRRPKIGYYEKPRDIAVMQTLWNYQIARESTLHKLCFPTIKNQRHVQGSLKRLVDEGYIGRRPSPIIQLSKSEFTDYYRHDGRQEMMYFIKPKGAVKIRKDQKDPQLKYIQNLSKTAIEYLNHRLDVSAIRACLELALVRIPEIALAVWYDENDRHEDGEFQLHDYVMVMDDKTERERRLPIRPDACFVLQDLKTDAQSLFFLEIDEGTESLRRRWRDKVMAYLHYYNQGFQERYQFNGEGYRVLTVCRSLSGKQPEKRKMSLTATTYNFGGRSQFWFAGFDQVMPDGIPTGEYFLADPIWLRARRKEIEQGVGAVLLDNLFV